MKKLFILLISIASINVYGELTCSSNGTTVYYVNGVLTSREKNSTDTRFINNLFPVRKKLR
jgi:hypothetical protein